ncbi:unnamed protein product [Closterium sp. Yama58-4]|nr:unnamed protein product [Closterium sp. Yama58-4]
MWNPAIADITLLALGTCAPQISLAVIDAVRRLGKTGGQDLGAGTIIGGAAFNIFPILAVCVLVPAAGTVKRIADVGLFLVEFLWSLWAYVWLCIVLQPDSRAQLIASRHSHGSDGSSGGTKGVSFGMRWRQQIVLSMMLHPSDYNALTEQGSAHPSHEQPAAHKPQPVAARVRRVVVHAVCFLWKALCALLIPPPDALHGYPAFITSILVITLIAALVVELASLFGCVTGVNSFVVAITLLATGTSIPDLIASVVAADHLPTADSAIANINASNCIIVFSGMGIPWLITTLYNEFVLGSANNVSTAGLGFSIIVFFLTTAVCMAILFLRRIMLGGELGGPRPLAWLSCLAFMLLWIVYMLLSSLNAYGIVGDMV